MLSFLTSSLTRAYWDQHTLCLNEMLSSKKYSKDKGGIGYNYDEASSSKTGQIKFIKANTESSGNGPINMGGPQN